MEELISDGTISYDRWPHYTVTPFHPEGSLIVNIENGAVQRFPWGVWMDD